LQATGDAPIMKQKNYKVDADKRIDWIITFIRKYLKLEDAENLVRQKNFNLGFRSDQFYRNSISDKKYSDKFLS
jgi:hypothetical protein